MSQSNSRVFYGIHSITPYSRTTGMPYGEAKVLGEASVNLAGELHKLTGGSSRYPYAIEDGLINTEITLKVKEYPSFLYELFLGKKPTDVGVDAAGTVSTLTNKNGTSVVAATGIASIAVKSAAKADLKFTKYAVKVVSATTVDVYAMSDIDFASGAALDFVDDSLKVTSSPLTITTGAATDIPSIGLTLTGGAGTIAMVIGDTATFQVLPLSTKSMSVRIGGSADVYPEFGLIIHGQKNGQREMVEIDIFRAKGIGMPMGFQEKAFSEAQIKIEGIYDSVKNGVFDIRHISPS